MDNSKSSFSTQLITSEEIAGLDAFLNINCVGCTQEETVLNLQRYMVKDLDVFRQTINKIKHDDNKVTLPEDLPKNIDHFLEITNWNYEKELSRRVYNAKKQSDKPPKPKPNPQLIFNKPSPLIQPGSSKLATVIEKIDDPSLKNSQEVTITPKETNDESSHDSTTPSALSQENDSQQTGKSETPGKVEQEMHPQVNQVSDSKKRKASLYCIEKARNVKRFAGEIESAHVVNWNPTSTRGYGVIVSGPGHYKGAVYNILGRSKQDFGGLKNMKQEDNQTIVIVSSSHAQEMVADIINNEGKGLTATTACHRFPIIKFSVHKSLIGDDPSLLVQEVLLFNLKNFLKMKFEFLKTYSPKGSPYANILIVCAPKIREFIAINLRGMLWVRTANVQVSDHFDLKRCYSCGSCGHRWCTRQNVCLRCSGPHKVSRCQSTYLRCPSCNGNHQAFSLECHKMVKAIDKEMDKVDYTYTTIMAGRGF